MARPFSCAMAAASSTGMSPALVSPSDRMRRILSVAGLSLMVLIASPIAWPRSVRRPGSPMVTSSSMPITASWSKVSGATRYASLAKVMSATRSCRAPSSSELTSARAVSIGGSLRSCPVAVRPDMLADRSTASTMSRPLGGNRVPPRMKGPDSARISATQPRPRSTRPAGVDRSRRAPTAQTASSSVQTPRGTGMAARSGSAGSSRHARTGAGSSAKTQGRANSTSTGIMSGSSGAASHAAGPVRRPRPARAAARSLRAVP